MQLVLQVITTLASVVAAAPVAEQFGMRLVCLLLRGEVAPGDIGQPMRSAELKNEVSESDRA
jgi:hypothetical protein